MKTMLVGPELEENLGLRYLSGALRREGHRCEIVPFNRTRELTAVAARIRRRQPRLVGLALVAQHRFGDVQALVQALRREGYRGHLTAGGHFASLRAQEVLRDTPGLDSILHHDAEERIVTLARWLDANPTGDPPRELDGISWRSKDGLRHRAPERVAPVDSLPLPLRRRPDRCLGYATAPIISSRGCAGSCSFCSIHAWHGQVRSGRLRFRAPERVAHEMAALHREHGVRVFVFHDDDFIHPDRRRALARCREILDAADAAIGEPFAFVVKARPDDVDEPLFTYLKSRGLVRVYVGIETHSRQGIRTLNRRVTPEQNERALAILADLDVYACFNLLIFHPDSTTRELGENLDFLERHVDVPFDVARTELYARSALEDRMVREGRAIGDYRGFDYRIEDPVAEAAFGLFAAILWERQFGGDSILHRVQGLRLRLGMLERFHPEHAPRGLRHRVQALVREANADTVRHLRRFVETARDLDGVVPPGVLGDLRHELAGEIRARLRAQRLQLAALSSEVESRAAIARSGRGLAFLVGQVPRLVTRAAALVPGAAMLLGTVSCGTERRDFADPPPPPCTQLLALHFASPVPPRSEVTAPFATSSAGQLDVVVDWTFPESRIGITLAHGCSPSPPGACQTTRPVGVATEKPYRFSLRDVPAGSNELRIANLGESQESVVAQVVLRSGACP